MGNQEGPLPGESFSDYITRSNREFTKFMKNLLSTQPNSSGTSSAFDDYPYQFQHKAYEMGVSIPKQKEPEAFFFHGLDELFPSKNKGLSEEDHKFLASCNVRWE